MIPSMQQNNTSSPVQFGFSGRFWGLGALLVATHTLTGLGGGFIGKDVFGKSATDGLDTVLKNTQAELKATKDWNVYLTSSPGQATIPNYLISADSSENFYGSQFANLNPKTTRVAYKTFDSGPNGEQDWEALGIIDLPSGVAKDMQGNVRGTLNSSNSNSILSSDGKPLYSFQSSNGELVYLPANGAVALPPVDLKNTTSKTSRTQVATGAEAFAQEAAPVTEEWSKLLPSFLNFSAPVNTTTPYRKRAADSHRIIKSESRSNPFNSTSNDLKPSHPRKNKLRRRGE